MSKYKSRGEAIKDLRKKAGFSQEELAKMLNTTKQTIYKYESGIVTNIPSDKIEAMSKIFKVSPAVIMGWDSNSPLYEAAAGEGRYSDGTPIDQYAIHLQDGEFLAKVVGSSMEPTLQEGDMVVIAAQNVFDYNGQMCLVKINGDEATIKRVQKRDDGLLLIGDNVHVYSPHFFTPQEVMNLPVTIEGVVIKLIREL